MTSSIHKKQRIRLTYSLFALLSIGSAVGLFFNPLFFAPLAIVLNGLFGLLLALHVIFDKRWSNHQ